MTSRTERFERKANAEPKPVEEDDVEIIRFPPEEEAVRLFYSNFSTPANVPHWALLNESNELKRLANNSFAAGEFPNAINIYNTALATCPKYLYYEHAVLKSNVAACYLKTSDWKEAVKAAGECLDLLDLAEGKKKVNNEEKNDTDAKSTEGDKVGEPQEEEAEEEIISAGAVRAEDTSVDAGRKRDIERIRAKALLRRGKARVEVGSWSSLTGAADDYKLLSTMPDITATDKKVVQRALVELPPRIKVVQEKEMGEMMGKLKELGNGILKPFGLSTDSFNMVKDDKTGGYSLNFNQGGK